MNKIKALLAAMQVGREVADPTLWKQRQDFGNKLGLLILALVGLAKAFGYEITFIDQEVALVFGGFIATVWNIVLTYATSRKVGLQSKPEAPVLPEPPETGEPGKPGDDDLYRG